jgi:hypothetical protein
MASGRLAAMDLAALTNNPVYVVTATKLATFNLNLVNRTSASIKVRIAFAVSIPPALGEYIEYDFVLPANGVYEKTAVVLDATKIVSIYPSAIGVSAVLYGFEE